MTPTMSYTDALVALKTLSFQAQARTYLNPLLDVKAEVLERFQPIFAPDHLPQLTEQEFRSFLLFENNHHWSGLQRHWPMMCADMNQLRNALGVLLDEAQSVEQRLDQAVAMIHGLGKAVATAILLVMHPDKYAVWNSTSEEALKKMDLWPGFERRDGLGRRYLEINELLVSLAHDLEIDLWTLDGLLWAYLVPGEALPEGTDAEELEVSGRGTQPDPHRFELERHLHEFLRDNWNRTDLGREWKLYGEPGDDEAGYEYPCGVGRIDLLARHRKEARWLVVELKREQTSDATVGQVLRYMGWVKKHMAVEGERVNGLIIAREADDALRYAASMMTDVDLQLYEVSFRLRPVQPLGA